ncbi:NUMOD3 domain-containing DNA-binding protein [Rufibacter tibetensis]|uniref:NUMOD3 domain-containing DNA-binding protein n=1 Tax=Rufibacter tibetensis TaxID=512763 RepID=UPI000782529F|nr:NUMOD3 domain-containing DNA-binding protein [Rufibacter tibetensis]
MINEIPQELRESSGVYQIVNLINGKIYIGSTKLFKVRYQKHKFELLAKKHPNKHLQNSYIKFGEENFVFRVIYTHMRTSEETDKQFLDRLLKIENELILKNKSNVKEFGYNLRISAYSNNGISHSEDALTRVKGKKLSVETRLKMSVARTGEKHHSLSINEKIAKEIRLLISLGYRNQNIANHFNISKSIVNDIKNNGSWKHIVIEESDLESYTPPSFSRSPSRLNADEVIVLKLLIEQNIRPVIIAEFLGIKPRTISDIKCKKTYSHISLSESDRMKYGKLIDFQELKSIEQDRADKKRGIRKAVARKGSSNNQSKLKEEQVLEIMAQILAGNTLTDIAQSYGVSMHSISKIKSGNNWAHLTGFEKQRSGPLKGENNPNFKHSKETVNRILQMAKNGDSTKSICESLGLEKTFVNRVKAGKIKR